MKLAHWLAERKDTALQIARTKQGADRRGWLEDADYFRLAELAAQRMERLENADNSPLRMFIALKLMRAWNNGTAGFSADVVLTVNQWIDGGMKGPIPWPDSPFFAEWAATNGFSNVNGHVGFILCAELTTGVVQ